MSDKCDYKNTLEYNVFLSGIYIGVVSIILFLFFRYFNLSLYKILPDCPVHKLTGYYCPGCGGTRAFYAMLRGDILLSLHYNPLVILMIVCYFAFMIKGLLAVVSEGRLKFIKIRKFYAYIVIAITVLQWIYKNIFLK